MAGTWSSCAAMLEARCRSTAAAASSRTPSRCTRPSMPASCPRPARRRKSGSWPPTTSRPDVYQHGQLDLTALLETETSLALPMKPLCREGCRGLCPVCGGNRNITACACETPAPDPRLGGPQGLRPSGRDRKEIRCLFPSDATRKTRGRKRRTHYKLVGADAARCARSAARSSRRTASVPTAASTRGAKSSRSRGNSLFPAATEPCHKIGAMKIAVDAMGGDFGPAVVVEGAVAACRGVRACRRCWSATAPPSSARSRA